MRHIGLAMVLGTLATVAALSLAAHESVNQTTMPASSQSSAAVRTSDLLTESSHD